MPCTRSSAIPTTPPCHSCAGWSPPGASAGSPAPASTTIPADVGADVVGIGADLEPATLVAAYRRGLFPMPVRTGDDDVLAWWSPDPRGVLPLDGLMVSRSLRRSCQRYTVRIDTAFDDVVAACADPSRQGRWITPDIAAAYRELHRLGWAHSIEAWTSEGELAGGLYGVHVGGLFAGESMFHWQTDASKVALVGLVEHLRRIGAILLDVQWATPHLRTLGVVELPRATYLAILERVVAQDIDWHIAEGARSMGP